jgi:drug/metabolite transporter (DMT)-like permease
MSRPHLIMLGALAAIWGASFMFIEIALRELEPATLVFFRLLLATLALLPVAALVPGTFAAARENWRRLTLMGAVNSALPFWFLTWGQTRIDSGLAAIVQASAPLLTVVLGWLFTRSERVRGLRLVGILVGFVGVGLIVGDQRGGAVAGALAVVVAALFYAAAGLYGARRLAHVAPLGIALGAMASATLLTAPAGLAQLPAEAPGAATIGSLVFLGVGGSAIAYLLYFAIMVGAGASYAILVTYLVPALALLYGAFLLDEEVTLPAIAGLALILGGVALGTRRARVASAA